MSGFDGMMTSDCRVHISRVGMPGQINRADVFAA